VEDGEDKALKIFNSKQSQDGTEFHPDSA